MQGSEWKYLLIISFVFALPSLLSLFAPFTIEEYDVHHKIFELQADINSFLYQQKLLTMTQQNITLILSNSNNKLIENENLLLSCQSSPNDLQNQTKGDRLLEELMDEIIDLSKLLRVSLKNIENLQNQLPKLEQQIPILDSQGVQIIEQVVSNLIFEELQKGINSSYQSNESFALLNEHMYNFSHGQLTDIVSKVSEQIQNRTQTSQTSNDYFEFPNVDIIAIVTNFTSPTYQVHQNGIFPSLGINPKLMIGGPEKVISSNLSLGECWAMEGTHGTLTIKLAKPVHLAGVTIAHISKLDAIDLTSAPSFLEIYGSLSLEKTFSRLFANIKYDIHSTSSSQYFSFPAPTKNLYQFVQFRILGNYGNPRYTCIYHVELHGFQSILL